MLTAVPPLAWAGIRVTCAAMILLALAFASYGFRGVPKRDLARLALYALFGVALNQILFTEGLARTTPAHSALLNTTIPVSTFFFAFVLGREAITKMRVVGLVVAMAGVLVLLRVENFTLSQETVLGDILTVCNASSFGLFLVISRNIARRYPPLVTTAWTMFWGALMIDSFGFGALRNMEWALFEDASIAIAGGFVIVFATVIAYLLNYFALSRVESSTVALFIYLQPILATALSIGLGQESLTLRFVLSAALIFLGVYVVNAEGLRARSRARREQAHRA